MATQVDKLLDEDNEATNYPPDEKYYVRKFLNAERGTALIEVDGRVSFDKDGVKRYIDGDVSITDCSRKISLEFYSYLGADRPSYEDDATVADRLDKLDLLITELALFRAWYADNAEID